MSENIRGQEMNMRSSIDFVRTLTTSEYGHRIALSYIMVKRLPFAFLCNFDKGITSHVLDTIVCFVHELKEFVDDCF